METRIIVVLIFFFKNNICLTRLDVIGRLRVTGNRLNLLVKIAFLFVYLGTGQPGEVSDSYCDI